MQSELCAGSILQYHSEADSPSCDSMLRWRLLLTTTAALVAKATIDVMPIASMTDVKPYEAAISRPYATGWGESSVEAYESRKRSTARS